MQLRFQKCNITHLNQLTEISRTTFVASFEKDNDLEDFKKYITTAFNKETIKKQLCNESSFFYFCFKDEKLAGYFKLNIDNAQTDVKSEESIELERIYVRQEFQGQQIGQSMLKEAIRIASKLNKAYLWLGVWERNTDAIRFYQKHRFSKFDTHPYYIGNDRQTDWLMRFDLTNFQQD